MSDELDGMRRDQAAAALMQRRMLPPSSVQLLNLRIDYQLWPAAELTGDFVDVVERPNSEVVFIVADVAGHGTSAALVTVLLKSFMSRLAAADASQRLSDPAALLQKLNEELLAIKLGCHVCALCGVFSANNVLMLAGGGMLPGPMLHQCEQSIAATVELSGKALGLFQDPGYVSTRCELAPGDRLTVVTDGVLEIVSGSDLPAKEAQLARAAAQRTQALFWESLALSPQAGGSDDLTWFCLERVA